ncbi:MAG: LCP family protein [Clostridium celatum]|uniref:LCP family protein n=1 Tax=Clostridium celatum TaxID=36834 RepID=UPI001F2FEE11|nr:LCP family protein [Clostridium celatum]MCE9656765.1 LCP family protein [Clostridium celatum]MDU3722100.1 LCP family protein [Clostridium celatum]MDY3359149.1 LCP family protein [Clostridium celatum]
MRMKKSTRIILLSISIVIGIIIIGIVATGFYAGSLLNKIEEVKIEKDNIGIKEEVQEKLKEYEGTIKNIALFGIDTDENGIGRSDAIMIATLDTEHKKLKITSIMRDSYVDIEGYGKDKLNHAYAYGGAELAMNTLNKNFDLNVEDFATVNFSSLPKIVDQLGGIDLDIDSEEMEFINGYIGDLNNTNGTYSEQITEPGIHHVNGTQAMAYCRIRYTSGDDYKRTERQREVLSQLFNKIMEVPVTSYPSLLAELLPMVKTSLSSSEILELGNEVLKIGTKSIEQERFPIDGYCEGDYIDGVFYLTFDEETTINQMHEYIFEDNKTW